MSKRVLLYRASLESIQGINALSLLSHLRAAGVPVNHDNIRFHNITRRRTMFLYTDNDGVTYEVMVVTEDEKLKVRIDKREPVACAA